MLNRLGSATEKPLVTIGMGVYNAEQFLTDSLQSILDQDYPNFELIISDNGSTDLSENICRNFTDRDPRISYRRNETNINPLKNGEMLLKLSSGVYHTWAADHDIYHPRYLTCLVDLLEREGESVVMAYPDTRYIDIDGNKIKDIREDVDTRGLSAPERFKKAMWGLTYCTPMYGLFRASALKKVWKMRNITGPDRVFLNEFSLCGEYAHHEEELFYMRQNRPAENYVETKKRQSDLFVSNGYETMVPSIMRDHALMEVVAESALDPMEKEELAEDILRYHHAEPYKHSKTEMENLMRHGRHHLMSNAESDEDKRSTATDCLHIAQISRMFRPELAPQLDHLSDICSTVMRGGKPSSDPALGSSFESSAWPKHDAKNTAEHHVGTPYPITDLSHHRPLISIGMTIYNQSPFLEKTLKSILGQEHGDFELCIIDNASQDNSFDICEQYAQSDHRVRVLRNKFNVGKVVNFDQVLKHCSGEYFMWSTGHDLYHRAYLTRLLDTFDTCANSVVLVVPDTALIDEKDNLVQSAYDHLPDTQRLPATERFKRTIWNFRLGNLSGGLFRNTLLKQIWEPFNVRGPMHIIAAGLSLVGAVAHLKETLFFKRMTNRYEIKAGKQCNPHARTLTLRKSEAEIPYTMLAFEHIDMVRRSTLNPSEKNRLYEEIKNCFNHRFNLQDEALEFLKNAVQMVGDLSPKGLLTNQALSELAQLADVCSYFHDDNRYVFDRFNKLILQMTPN